MKRNICLLLFLFIGITAYSQTGKLRIKVLGIKNNVGSVAVALYSNSDTFLKEPYTWVHKEIENNKDVAVVIDDIPPGTYGVSVFHDENNNKKIDKNMVGIPTESYGFGNNARGSFGPPDFEESSIRIQPNQLKKTVILLEN